MRSLFCGAVIVGLTSFCLASEQEATGNEKDDSSTPIVDVETLTGAELFDHQWSHYSAKQRAVADKKAGLDKKANIEDQLLTAGAGRRLARTASSLSGSQRAAFLRSRGMSLVGHQTGDGLGPLHNATSCAECHERGGAAGVKHNATLLTIDPRSPAVVDAASQTAALKSGRYGKQLLEVFPALLNERGVLSIETVLHDRSAKPGYEEIRDRLISYVPDGIADEWFDPAQRTSQAIAERPVIAGRHKDVDFYLSQRNPPPLFGLGFIDLIKPERLAAVAEQQAREGRVSGRVAQKFGWRGQIASVNLFVAQACAGELGLTHPTAIQPGDPADISYQPPGEDMSTSAVSRLSDFVTALPSPVERGLEDSEADTFQGETVFNNLGCADCHVPDMHPAMSVFSDFLLHDMGEQLQAPSPAPMASAKTKPKMTVAYESRGPISGGAPVYYGAGTSQGFPAPEEITRPEQPQFPRGEREIPTEVSEVMTWDDMQREWRTPPLWGVADTGPYMHDGRAQTLKEAILLHGGEAHASKDLFVALTPKDQSNLIGFLKTLQVPTEAELREPVYPIDEPVDPNDGNAEEGLASEEDLQQFDANLSGGVLGGYGGGGLGFGG